VLLLVCRVRKKRKVQEQGSRVSLSWVLKMRLEMNPRALLITSHNNLNSSWILTQLSHSLVVMKSVLCTLHHFLLIMDDLCNSFVWISELGKVLA